MTIQIVCEKCDKDLELVVWNLGFDVKLKVKPCGCSPLCDSEDCDDLDCLQIEKRQLRQEHDELQIKYTEMVVKIKAMIP
jgi:hypothetical protein